MKKRVLQIVVLFLLISFITNPSLTDFEKNFPFFQKTEKKAKEPRVIFRQKMNFLLFSVYELGELNISGDYTVNQEYIGFMKNFFLLKNNVKSISKDNEDTSVQYDTTKQ